MERYYPLLKRYDTTIALYLPKASTRSNVIEPTNIVLKNIDVSGNPAIIAALRSLTRYAWRPDFVTANGIIIESKGQMDKKFPSLVRAFREQHPILFRNYRLAFQNPRAWIPTRSSRKMTYGEWADSISVPWCHLQPRGRNDIPTIPQSWLTDAFIGTLRPLTNPNDFELWGDDTIDEDYEYEDD